MKTHHYTSKVNWTGNQGEGTKNYASYKRNYTISIDNKPDLLGSSDPAFLGDPSKHNPEELFLSSISSCHALWYLHLCAENGIVIISYVDKAEGIMKEEDNGKGRFTSVTLNPKVKITNPKFIEKAQRLHVKANEMCFIANSCNFDIQHQAHIYT